VFTIGSAEEVARNSKDLADIAKLRVSRACSQKPARFSVIRGDAIGPVRVRLESPSRPPRSVGRGAALNQIIKRPVVTSPRWAGFLLESSRPSR